MNVFHFLFSFFLIFCSFLHFFIFQCVSFFILSEEKVSSFLFSCISFKYVLLLALVSEFNCFLRSRCSMEMWCPDDIGRDSWDWVGPPAWGRACFNSPEWGGGSSPVKTEPPQILLLLLLSSLLLFGTHLDDGCMSTRVGDALHTEYKNKRGLAYARIPLPQKKPRNASRVALPVVLQRIKLVQCLKNPLNSMNSACDPPCSFSIFDPSS